MRPIKFRGRDLKTGEYIFSDIIDIGLSKASFGYWTKDCGQWVLRWKPVVPESVAQLVGYDANGKEVYEGDTVVRYDSEEEFAEAPENGVSREVVLYTQVNPDLESYYCFLKENQS